MTWWQAVLSALGIIGAFVAVWLVGDRVDIWFHNRQTVKLQELRAARLASQRKADNDA